MSNKPFDIAEFIRNNNFSFGEDFKNQQKDKANKSRGTFTGGYNDVRKSLLSEAKVKDGKFSIEESLRADKKAGMSPETKRRFLEVISTYNRFSNSIKRESDLVEVSKTLGAIVEAARELTLNETEDWFDKVTVKRNMKQLEKLDKEFDKIAAEAKSLDQRMHALYEDMGMILNRYYDISDINEEEMKRRLGQRSKERR